MLKLPFLTEEQEERQPKPRCGVCGTDPAGVLVRWKTFPLDEDKLLITLFCSNRACRHPFGMLLVDNNEKRIVTPGELIV